MQNEILRKFLSVTVECRAVSGVLGELQGSRRLPQRFGVDT